jgi:hypothetical protein
LDDYVVVLGFRFCPFILCVLCVRLSLCSRGGEFDNSRVGFFQIAPNRCGRSIDEFLYLASGQRAILCLFVDRFDDARVGVLVEKMKRVER